MARKKKTESEAPSDAKKKGPYEKKDLTGALFKDEDRSKENQPHYRGYVKVQDQEYWVAGWIKKSRGGMVYMSLALTAKEEQTNDRVAAAEKPF
jgi:uncharacterized protein (DUF736 family)